MQPKQGHDDRLHLHDILESAKQAVGYVAGQRFEEFWDDYKTRDAVAMRLTIIGEAARHVSSITAAAIPNVPFHQIRGLRNRIAHTYEQVDFKEVWKIAQHDLKPLIGELERYLTEQKQRPSQPGGIQPAQSDPASKSYPSKGRRSA